MLEHFSIFRHYVSEEKNQLHRHLHKKIFKDDNLILHAMENDCNYIAFFNSTNFNQIFLNNFTVKMPHNINFFEHTKSKSHSQIVLISKTCATQQCRTIT